MLLAYVLQQVLRASRHVLNVYKSRISKSRIFTFLDDSGVKGSARQALNEYLTHSSGSRRLYHPEILVKL